MSKLPRNQILLGDAMTRLAELPERSIDCVITSPPYFRLRDYQVEGQLGLESHVNQWVVELLAVTSQVARVMVPTGTLWLNLGDSYSTHDREGAPAKSLLGAPERLLLGLIEQGWRVRNKIVWAKNNPMPTSVTDRLATTYEVIYVLSRSRHYFFDLDAIREPHSSRPSRPPNQRRRQPDRPKTARSSSVDHPEHPDYLGPNADGDSGLKQLKARGLLGHPLGKNPGDVWSFATSSYRGAHFATYPEALVERMVKAGVPEQRCVTCRTPGRRPVRRLGATAVRLALKAGCDCSGGSEPGLVLDPFLGSGTTAVVAERQGRDWLGIELNPDFVQLASERLTAARAATEAGSSPPPNNTTPHRKEEL